ncbi:hypothetical protein PV326_011333 [Microctonus aethiopoides]|nr:hypothetical protein PV326_011333 [Microctonus aethiopoides]
MAAPGCSVVVMNRDGVNYPPQASRAKAKAHQQQPDSHRETQKEGEEGGGKRQQQQQQSPHTRSFAGGVTIHEEEATVVARHSVGAQTFCIVTRTTT